MEMKSIATVGILLISVCCSADDTSRKLKRTVEPQYPELAKRMHISGSVRLQLAVAQDGRVKEIRILGGSPILIMAAQDAVKRWRYEPGAETLEIVEVHFQPPQ